jgi:hypothetical protein
MSKRALILWACLGTLLLTAGQVATFFPAAPQNSPSATASGSTPADTASRHFDVLSAVYASSTPSSSSALAPPPALDEQTLWLARAMYSETKLPHEQELVGWVIRNRVETQYRGNATYRETVLDPYQFSAFNPGSSHRSFLFGLSPDTPIPSWQQALWTAHYVRHANEVHRPFSIKTRHFFSEQSMPNRQAPFWANHRRFVSPRFSTVDEERFRFYEEIS